MSRKHEKDETREMACECEPNALAEDIEALQTELEKLKTDAAESHERYVRTLADFDNYRKRQREEAARTASVAVEEIVLQLLPIIDNFRRTIEAAEAQHSYDALVEGDQMILRQLGDLLTRLGVSPIEAEGREFDPLIHEALMRVETDDVPENTIIDELEKGYEMNGKVIRPARVRVAAPTE